jgi:chloride channel 3/4/5
VLLLTRIFPPHRRTTFKRKQKGPKTGFSIPRFFSSPLGANGGGGTQSPASRAGTPHARPLRTHARAPSDADVILSYLNTPGDAGGQLHDTKDASGLDWYVEGPGRRVGYDDLTAIDWIFEYAKERQRLRYLQSSASGLLGHLRQLADASQVWWILIAAGLASGLIAAFINIASDWLGDLKTGVCSNAGGDGKFYLNRVFCCWGYTGECFLDNGIL